MHNENRSRQTQSSASTVTNLNLQDTAGVTLGQSSGNTITVTDQGAIGGAFDFGYDSLSMADNALGRAVTFADSALGDSLDLGRDVLSESLQFADNASSRVLEAADMAGERSQNAFERAFEFGRDLFSDSLTTVTGVLREGQAQLGNTVSNLNNIARQQSTSEAERVQDIASKTLYVAAAIVGFVMLAVLAKGSK